jgi:hypothetical protein
VQCNDNSVVGSANPGDWEALRASGEKGGVVFLCVRLSPPRIPPAPRPCPRHPVGIPAPPAGPCDRRPTPLARRVAARRRLLVVPWNQRGGGPSVPVRRLWRAVWAGAL